MFSPTSDQENDFAITSQSSHDLACELANISQKVCKYISIIYLQEIIHVFIEERLFYVRLCCRKHKRTSSKGINSYIELAERQKNTLDEPCERFVEGVL